MGLTACDDGSIPRKEHTATHTGFTAKLTGHITGADSWPEYYQLVLAGFGDSDVRDHASARQPRREQQREPHPA